MNWKLIFQLSVFGLIMAFGTVSLIPEKVEPAFWLVIFIFCAYIIAKRGVGKYFLHGFFVSIFNCVWILAVHLIFYKTFMQHHAMPSATNANMQAMQTHPRLLMLIIGAIIGVASGLVLGLFAFIMSRFVKSEPVVGA